MPDQLNHLHDIFSRTRERMNVLMGILSPIIEGSEDRKKKVFAHHMYEEEEERAQRIDFLLPQIRSISYTNGVSSDTFHLLRDLKREESGIHNFLEHLELALFDFVEDDHQKVLPTLLEQTKADYLAAKEIFSALQEHFPNALLEREKLSDHHPIDSAAHQPFSGKGSLFRESKRLSVGSLRGR